MAGFVVTGITQEMYDERIRAKAIDECIKIIEETCWRDADMLVENIREFWSKAKHTERDKTVDEVTERLASACSDKSFKVELDGVETDVITVDDLKDLVLNVAELVKGGGT